MQNTDIKRVIYCFWTGTNEMSSTRKHALESFTKTCGVEVILVTPETLPSYILPEHPLHPAYEYVSHTGKSDILRAYFMNFHGGGYSDIKHTTGNWSNAFDDIASKPDMILNGYHEADAGCVAGDATTQSFWRELPGCCSFIVRPHSPFTEEWYKRMIQVLDTKHDALKANPAKHTRAGENASRSPGYPLSWAELMGNIFHRLACDYRSQFLFTVPTPVFYSYI